MSISMSIAASVFSHGHLVYNECSRDMKAIQDIASALLQLKKNEIHKTCSVQSPNSMIPRWLD